MVDWTQADNEKAFAEGWGVFLIDGDELYPEIQRFDESDIFESDEEALSFVERRAGDGSVIHRRALAFLSGGQ